jgi:hypothetical protein
MTAKPPYADDWEGLAAVAERLRDDRARDDPKYVQAGKLTGQQLDDRARLSRALAQQWRAIARREPMPQLDAHPQEILLDLEAATAATARIAAAKPDLAVQLGSFQVRYTEFARAVAALLWHQQLDGCATARIVFIHEFNQRTRALRAERPTQPSAPTAPALPPAPPLRQRGLF